MQEWQPRKRNKYRNRLKNLIGSLNRIEKIVVSVCFLALVIAGIRLGEYIDDRNRSQNVNENLREVYEAATTGTETMSTPMVVESSANTITESPTTEEPSSTTPPTSAPAVPASLPIVRSSSIINESIALLQEQSPYIVGWLTVPDQVDEAVAQLDHDFFLDHDVYGNQNMNGALFLDSLCSLSIRPYTIIIYGHNMRSGEKFGKLSRYQDQDYYEEHKVLSFTSLHDSADYEIFAAGSISVNRNDPHYVNFVYLTSSNTGVRQHEISTLLSCSDIQSDSAVRADDQLLILVTCEGNEDERWIVCARRI